jgi:hypothetical protein
MTRYRDYWDYYSSTYDWPNGAAFPDLRATRRLYAELGISKQETESLVASGYVSLDGESVIDRYYGGALRGSDLLTRIPRSHFIEWYRATRAGTPMFGALPACTVATSLNDLERQVKSLEEGAGKGLLFRGQTAHHGTTRLIKNPNVGIAGLGEVSLIPSIWRNLLRSNPNSFHTFYGLDLLEWSKVIYSQFDIPEIDRRVKERVDLGEWIHSAQDMEDSDDPLLSQFGRVRLDLSMGMDHNLADLLNTLLQHYGLVSPYLDLSSNLRVALFFASHKFIQDAGGSNYAHVGSNNSESILYVFKHDKREMSEYMHDRVLHNLTPLRPERQACVICRSSPYALNLAGLFLVGAIRIDFELTANERLSAQDLFPSSEVDTFLGALIANCRQPQYVTQFPRSSAAA